MPSAAAALLLLFPVRLFAASAASSSYIRAPGVPLSPADSAAAVVEKAAIRMDLGPFRTALSPDLVDFLLDHPDLSASLARGLGLAPYSSFALGSGAFSVDDGAGSRGSLVLTERGKGERVYYIEGVHESPLLPAIRAAAVVRIALKRIPHFECRSSDTESEFEVYVRFRSHALSGLARALRPVARRIIARKFARGMEVADKLGRLMAEDPRLVAETIESLQTAAPQDKDRLLGLMSAMNAGAAVCY